MPIRYFHHSRTIVGAPHDRRRNYISFASYKLSRIERFIPERLRRRLRRDHEVRDERLGEATVSGENRPRPTRTPYRQLGGVHAAIHHGRRTRHNENHIGHLVGPEDLILHDSLFAQQYRASGALLSRRQPTDHSAQRLRSPRPGCFSGAADQIPSHVVIVEGVYRHGRRFLPDVPKFIEVKKRHRCLLMVDEAQQLRHDAVNRTQHSAKATSESIP